MRNQLIKIIAGVLVLLCSSGMMFVAGKPLSTTTCSQGDDSANDVCTATGTDWSLSANATGFEFTAGATYTSYGITLRLKYSSTSGTVEVRIGDAPDLSSYTAHCTITVDSSAADGELETCQWTDSSDNPVEVSITNTSVYYVGVVENSGDLRLRYADTTCANSSGRYAGAGWNMASTNARDSSFVMVECAP